MDKLQESSGSKTRRGVKEFAITLVTALAFTLAIALSL
jgi:hypothetical protein